MMEEESSNKDEEHKSNICAADNGSLWPIPAKTAPGNNGLQKRGCLYAEPELCHTSDKSVVPRGLSGRKGVNQEVIKEVSRRVADTVWQKSYTEQSYSWNPDTSLRLARSSKPLLEHKGSVYSNSPRPVQILSHMSPINTLLLLIPSNPF